MSRYKTFNHRDRCSSLFSVVRAQEKPQTADAARREKAVELLQSLVSQLPTLQPAENRARIGANIADSRTAMKALAKGDTERALKIVNDFNGDPQAKQRRLAR